MKVIPATFQEHYARWLRHKPRKIAQAVADERWENEGGAIRPAVGAAKSPRRYGR